jgi:DNA-binding XRE family transcriptional regulator
MNMKLADVLKKERGRKKLTVEDVAASLGLPVEAYEELESGTSPLEEWGPKLPQIAITLSTPTARLISETGKAIQLNNGKGHCGQLIRMHRERCDLSREELVKKLDWPVEQLVFIENEESPLETYAPILLRFAEVIEQPIFNLFYPCGVPLDKLNDYP